MTALALIAGVESMCFCGCTEDYLIAFDAVLKFLLLPLVSIESCIACSFVLGESERFSDRSPFEE